MRREGKSEKAMSRELGNEDIFNLMTERQEVGEKRAKLKRLVIEGQSAYENIENDLKIRFYCEPAPTIVQLRKEEFEIRIEKYENQSTRENSLDIHIKELNCDARIKYNFDGIEQRDLSKPTQAIYGGFAENVDLQYLYYGDSLKENILVYKPAEQYCYSLRLVTGKLLPHKLADGGISLKTQNTNETIFRLPAPFMFDDAGERSDNVEYIMKEQEIGVYLLTVVADADWINATKRSFPITIDPTIFLQDTRAQGGAIEMLQVRKTTSSIEMYYDAHNSTPPRSYLDVGGKYSNQRLDGHSRIYFKFHQSLKTFFSDKHIDHVTFGMRRMNGQSLSIDNVPQRFRNLSLHEYTGQWTSNINNASVFDNNQFAAKSLVSFGDIEHSTDQPFGYDITGYFRSWLKGDGTGQLVLRSSVEDGPFTGLGLNTIYSQFCDGNTKEGPFMQVSYRNKTEIMGNKGFQFSCGRAGNGVVDLFSGKLSFAHEVLDLDSHNNVPKLQLIYSSNLSNQDFDTRYKCGRGWKLNILQRLEKKTYTLGHTSISIWEYTDAAGVVRYIQPQYYYRTQHGDGTVKQTVLDEFAIQKHKSTSSGIGLFQEMRVGGYILNESERTLTDEIGNKLYFNTAGYLIKIYDKTKEKITTIIYTTDCIQISFDSKFCSINFVNGYLKEIVYNNSVCKYEMFNGQLFQCIHKTNGQETNATVFHFESGRFCYVVDQSHKWIGLGYIYQTAADTNLSESIVNKIRYGTGNLSVGYDANDCAGEVGKHPSIALYQVDHEVEITYAHLYSLKTSVKKDGLFMEEHTFNKSGTLLMSRDAFGARKVSTSEVIDMLYLNQYEYISHLNKLRVSNAIVHPESINYVDNAIAAGPTSYRGKKVFAIYEMNELTGCFYVFSCEIKCSGIQLPTLRDRIAREDETLKFEIYAENIRTVRQFASPDPSNEDWQYVALIIKAGKGMNSIKVGIDSTNTNLTYQVRDIRLQRATGETRTISENEYCISDNAKEIVRSDLTPKFITGKRYVTAEYNQGAEIVTAEVDSLNRPIKITDARGKLHEMTYDIYGAKNERIVVGNTSMETQRATECNEVLTETYRDFNNMVNVVKADPDIGRIFETQSPIIKDVNLTTQYTYDTGVGISQSNADTFVKSMSANINSNYAMQTLTTTYNYNKGLLTKAQHMGGEMEVTYDGHSRPTKIMYNGSIVREFSYIEGEQITATDLVGIGYIECVTDLKATGQSITHVSYFDKYGLPRMVRRAQNKQNWLNFTGADDYILYQYNENGKLLYTENRELMTKEIYVYNDLFEVVGSETQNLIGGARIVRSETEQTETSSNSSIVKTSIYIDGQETPDIYTVKSDSVRSDPRISQVVQPDGNVITYTYNALGLLTNKIGLGNRPKENYGRLGAEISYNVFKIFPRVFDKSYSNIRNTYNRVYERNNSENIVELCDRISGIPVAIVKYQYDGAGRLIGENRVGISSYTCVYDAGGNLQAKNGKTYRYNLKNQLIGFGGSLDNMGYSVDGKPDKWFVHSLNNVLNAQLSWGIGGNISRYYTAGKTITYRYDGRGMRAEKIVNGTVHRYIYHGSMLLEEKRGNERIKYLYDPEGATGIEYDNKSYYFVKSLQGDIERIYNDDRYMVAEYVYDAWGAHSVVCYSETGVKLSDPPSNHIGLVNSLRYRGYFWDGETDLYYLESRYYDPVVGRFLSEDDVDYLAPESIGGLNLYAYCNNNPVMNIDPEGHAFFSFLIGLAITWAVSTIASQIVGANIVNGVGLAITGGTALVTGLMAISLLSPMGWLVGGITAIAGLTTFAFASAELQQGFTGNNWIKDAGMSDGWYNGLMIASSTIATLGSMASTFTYNFKISTIDKVGKLQPSNHSDKGYFGIRFKDTRGALRSVEIQRHAPHGFHYQLNSWNPRNMSVSTKLRWTWYLKKM